MVSLIQGGDAFHPGDWGAYLDVLTRELGDWARAGTEKLPNLIIALGVMVAFGVASRYVGLGVRRLARRTSANEAIVSLTSSVTRVAIVLAGLCVALGTLGLQKTVFSLLAGAGVVGLALGFAFQDLASNLIAGVAMGFRKPFKIDDIVETNGHFGFVHKLNLRNTLVRTFAGQIVVIPNKEVFENPLVNYTMTGRRRIEIDVGVAYDSDLERCSEVAREAVESLDFLHPEEDVQVIAKGFGESSIELGVRYWIALPSEVGYPAARHRGLLAVKRAFDEEGIVIPFPIRTLAPDEALLRALPPPEEGDGEG